MFSFFRYFKEKRDNRERILALDLLRGTFLVEIIVAHIAWHPSLLTFISGGNQLVASAAEGFFTISGLLVGYLYGPRVLGDTKKIFKKIWKRAFLLYCLATFFTLFYTAWAIMEPHSAAYQMIYTRGGLRFLVDTFTLRYAFGWAEFLNRYAMFMLFAPFAIWLIAKGRAWIMALASFAIWFFLRDTERFLPFSPWQLVFYFGMILGYYLPHIEAWFRELPKERRRVISITICSVAAVTYIACIYMALIAPTVLLTTNPAVQFYAHIQPYFDKNHLAPGRVAVGIVWFAALYMIYRRYEKQISRLSHGVLEVLGRQSLFVYGFHAFLLFIIDLYFVPPAGHSLFANTLVTLVVLTIIYIGAYYRGHVMALGRRVRRTYRFRAPEPDVADGGLELGDRL